MELGAVSSVGGCIVVATSLAFLFGLWRGGGCWQLLEICYDVRHWHSFATRGEPNHGRTSRCQMRAMFARAPCCHLRPPIWTSHGNDAIEVIICQSCVCLRAVAIRRSPVLWATCQSEWLSRERAKFDAAPGLGRDRCSQSRIVRAASRSQSRIARSESHGQSRADRGVPSVLAGAQTSPTDGPTS